MLLNSTKLVIHCEGEITKSDLLLDVLSSVFKVTSGQTLEVLLVKEIQDPVVDFAENGDPIPRVDPLDTSSILPEYSSYEYIVHGKIYAIENKMIGTEPIIAVLASFGGLLFRLQLPLIYSSSWVIDNNLFLLIKHQLSLMQPPTIHQPEKKVKKEIKVKMEPDSS
ncbi:probable DNA-directed RNA polymerases I, II, and III subunit RPABC3 [Panonychus citri]|uniref:probable DNA-directed RNA polymerases I, II, and III subunit RPABC3 n=1 Tax=Panonychus citri TaxID=50023 RepID=UPI002307FCD6|nr:probable DNA-directed RNA polymerases I, II, and III subunit RPABC3 [Panonychus citri]